MVSISQEAAKLKQTSFGGRLLRTIGSVYERCADQWLMDLHGSFTYQNQMAQWGDSAESTKVKISAASSVAKSAFAVKRMHDIAGDSINDDDQEKKDEATRQAYASLEESLPVFLQMIWDISAIDILNTLQEVCNKCLKDISVPWQIRYRRAVALQRLGRIFRDVGQVERADMSQCQ